MSGRQVLVPSDGLVAMTIEDSKPLLGLGWVEASASVSAKSLAFGRRTLDGANHWAATIDWPEGARVELDMIAAFPNNK